ncbi:MAG TPA: hypothetical protein VHO28_10585 [Ignavibacteriales bacterium]|nr:hypothetical protein [Ignavibacteriales bacterium]
MTRKLLLLTMLALTLCGALNAQEQDTIMQKPKMRTVFLTFFGTGYPEFLNLRLGWQINDEWSVAAKLSFYDSEADVFFTALYNIQITKYFPKSTIIINSIALSGGYYLQFGDELAGIELYTGWEGLYNWAVGFTYVNADLGQSKFHDFYPGFKVGLNFNI